MKYTLLVLSFVTTQVFATGSNHHNVYDNSVVNKGGNAVSDSYSNASSNSHSNSTAEGGNATGGNSDSYANNGGNSVNMTTMHNAPLQYHNTPAMGSLLATPTAPCALPIGGGGVGAGFGFNFMTAYINPECIKQETTKLAIAMGKTTTADEIFCTMEHAENTRECKALKVQLNTTNTSSNNSALKDSFQAKDVKRGLFGTTWDDTNKQWVFNTTL